MKKINEEFLHFLWKNQHLTGVTYYTTDNFDLDVLDPGVHNQDAGPDFSNARIRINNTIWAGNVELHINASDWIKHEHSNDPAYNTVILHVVYFNDCTITRSTGEPIPTAVLRFPVMLWDRFSDLEKNNNWISCQNYLNKIHTLDIVQWTSSLMIQKLEEKTMNMQLAFKEVKSHWDELFTRILFRGFGTPVNTFPFELLGLLVPYTILLRNKNTQFSLEALLFGYAGFLDTRIPNDSYAEQLRNEYLKFAYKPHHYIVPLQSWKFMRMRPSSFPSIRLAQLSSLIHYHFPMHEILKKQPDKSELNKLLKVRASDYWNTHYQFGKESNFKEKYIGDQFINTLIINTIVPYMALHARIENKASFMDYAIGLLEELPPEKNVILKKWGTFGISCTNALESQAILYLYKTYCTNKKCLNCQFGNKVLINGKAPN
ncbi:DUF2851 family protein [Bacteroidota bacterium]